jgi:hypothetical protein
MSLREAALTAAQASLQAMYPARVVRRGLQDPAQLGDAVLRQGLIALVAEGTSGWTEYAGGEAQHGTLRFAAVAYVLVDDGDDVTLRVEQAEAQLEAELLAWCATVKAAPLDAVYPREVQYSRGLEAPSGWLVMSLEALYV